MEQFYIRYIKEKSCYAALNYQDELKKYPNDSTKYTMELKGRLNEFKYEYIILPSIILNWLWDKVN